MLVEYDSNNSGGGWWLEDKDWKALEDAGWYVEWGKTFFCDSKVSFNKPPEGFKPIYDDSCPGHRPYETYGEAVKGERFLGGLARGAKKEFDSIYDAIKEFEKLTGQDVSDEGCNCCGPPHSFNWKDGDETGYASGEDLLEYIYPDANTQLSKRELLERSDPHHNK